VRRKGSPAANAEKMIGREQGHWQFNIPRNCLRTVSDSGFKNCRWSGSGCGCSQLVLIQHSNENRAVPAHRRSDLTLPNPSGSRRNGPPSAIEIEPHAAGFIHDASVKLVSGIAFEAWRDWRRHGFVGCPAGSFRRLTCSIFSPPNS
jgi:hypothetical protein